MLFVRLFDLRLFGFVFPLPLGVWEGLQFVIVALPGLFSYLFMPLTYVSPDSSDPEVLNPPHQLYGRRIASLQYRDVSDDSFNHQTFENQSSFNKRSRVVATLISRFRKRWKLLYLTALREHHRRTGTSHQTITLVTLSRSTTTFPQNLSNWESSMGFLRGTTD